MKEYSVKFPEPAFTDYPRTVENTVDWVAVNAEVEKSATPDFYVFGSDVPSPLEQSKIWAHYPNSLELPPVPGQNPNLPTPAPLSYFAGSVKTITTLATLHSPDSLVLDESNQTIWVGIPTVSSLLNTPFLWRINSDLSLTSYNFNSFPLQSMPFGPPTILISARGIVTITPNGKVFAIVYRSYTSASSTSVVFNELFELVNNSFVFRVNVPTSHLTVNSFVSDSSNNLYFAKDNAAVMRIDASPPVAPPYSTVGLFNPFPYFSGPGGNNCSIMGMRAAPSGDIIVDRLNLAGETYLASIPSTGGAGSDFLGPFNFSGKASPGNSLALDSSGNYYVCRDHLIHKITPAGSVSTEAGALTSGYVDGAYPSARFYRPSSIFLSSTNNLYVADKYNSRIRATSSSADLYSTVQIPDYIAINSNVAYSLQVSATNSPTSYSATSLPTGLTINASTGLISGTPTVVGVFSSTIRAENSFGGSTKGVVFQVFSALPTDYYNLPALRRAIGASWLEFAALERGDLLLAPSDQEVLFPWGESNKSYDLSLWGEPLFQVPVLPTPPSGFKYKYYIGARVSSASVGPILSP